MLNPDLIIYGGAFDPPHQGHIDCVQAAAERFPSSQIWITPAAQPAGAAGKHKNTTVSFDHRVKLCELAFAPLIDRHPQISISTVERDLPPPNFTIRTLAWVKATAGYKDLALLMGQDQLASFDRWRAPEEILKTASLIAVSRRQNEASSSGTAKATAESLITRLGLLADWVEAEGTWHFKGTDAKIAIIEKVMSDAESTALRQQLAGAENFREEWLPPQVLEYIKLHQLFKESHS